MRKTLERKENGTLREQLNGMDKFARDVANRLLDKYPDVDYFDLELYFSHSFNYEYAYATMRERKHDSDSKI